MKTKQFLLILLACLCFPFAQLWSNPVNGLLERIDSEASKKFIIQVKKGQSDFFELDQKGDKVVIRGNNYVNIATGLNWYLKYYAGIHLSWNGMTAKLPESLPPNAKLDDCIAACDRIINSKHFNLNDALQNQVYVHQWLANQRFLSTQCPMTLRQIPMV